MNKSIRGLIFEIIVMVIIIISTFLIFSNGRIDNEREELLSFANSSLDISVVNDSTNKSIKKLNYDNFDDSVDCDILKITNNTSYKTKYNLILRTTKISNINAYKIMVNSKIYELSELNYREDANYYYFVIDNFQIYNKQQNITFGIFLNDNYIGNYNESFSYSYMIEVVR